MSRSNKRNKKIYDPLQQLKSIARATIGMIPGSKVIKDHKDRPETKHKLSKSEQLDPDRER